MYETWPRKDYQMIIYTALIISWIIIIWWIWRVFFRQDNVTVDDTDTSADEQMTRYFMGEQVMLEGILTMSDDISQFSHLLTTKEKQQFGLKSFDIALNSYTGSVQVKWEVTWFKQQMPIIQVADVVWVRWSDEATTSWGDNIGNGSYTYVAWANLWIDLSVFPGYALTQLGNDIQIHDGTNTKLITITPFRCTPGDATKDCTVLKSVVENAQRFTNAAGMVFYNLSETEQWIAFNWTMQWYTLTAEPDVQLQTYASVFEIVDPTVFDSRLDEMKTLCKDINSRLATVSTHETVIETNGVVNIGMDGSTNAWVAASCIVTTSLSDPTFVKLTSYTWPSTPEDPTPVAQPTPDEQQPTVGTQPQPTATTVPTPAWYETWTTYPSVRWWTMYVERNVISYQWDVWTWQAGCMYKMDLSYRNNATWAAADGVIYECTPTWAATLKSAGYMTVGVATGVEFVRKDVGSTLQWIDIFIK